MISRTVFWRHPGHLLWILAAYVPFLWEMHIPFTGDQKTYIAIAMEMRERGEWLQPFLFGEPNYLKPPFQYWMTLLAWKVFGFNVFATFLPGVLALLGTAALLNEIASLLGERRWYVNAGLWFSVTMGAMTYALSAQMDIYVCFFYAASWWAALKFLAVREDSDRERKWLYWAFIIAGVSAWVKSPVYSAFWVIGFWIYLLISGEWLLFKNRSLYLAHFLGIGVGLIWYLVIFSIDRERFWDQYILQEQIQKGGNGGTLFNLWVPLLYMVFPATLLVFTALRSAWMGRRTAGILRFVVAWSIPPAVFFSFFPYRTSLYLFILVPALAILVDWGCFRANRTRTFLWLSRATGILVALTLIVAGGVLYRLELLAGGFVLGLALIGVGAAVVGWMGWMRLFTLAGLAAILFFRLGSITVSRGDHITLRNLLSPPDSSIAMLDESRDIWHEIGLLSVSVGHPMRRLFGYDDIVEHLELGGTLIFSDEQAEKYRITLDHVFGDRGQALNWKAWKRFKRRQKLPMKQLLLEGRESVPDLDEKITREFWIVRKS